MRFFLIIALFVVFAFVSARNGDSNENKSREFLKNKQTPSKLHPCRQPIIIGPCRAMIRRWAYDQRTDRCRVFSYGGCRGNDNNFRTLNEYMPMIQNYANVSNLLMEVAKGTQTISKHMRNVARPQSDSRCRLPIEAGSCLAYFRR
ncbi:hypothetical protein WR25_26222 isoform M [Diploscapter pachys]|uniref:BPTI/Kunitz inhibitor domain-containing protein n=1 Tax=Diploscapter pachys TaxID=2018661 RepID=A0A2A2LQY0_9BILA|nr:hypothetical protein WR25_26222 isoform A [Diploscapter pachys]PAV88652.1 hypothetical protein WR25_26222 isoform B [Diploscapter pachys]PAV88653.1 hypothetical protein WR25_26222 isoform C [Diploscapter pachys]PAV88654.1 hypothetical protein WR25_26222 isoform D [Diploscapter pachys]PAV88655.1 hypothetical protein WR25_26222 isoform E [Diploscapter pachys]